MKAETTDKKPSFPIVTPVLNGWSQVDNNMKSMWDAETEYKLFIGGEEKASVKVKNDFISCTLEGLNRWGLFLDMQSKEAAMCCMEEIMEFHKTLQKKYGNDKRSLDIHR